MPAAAPAAPGDRGGRARRRRARPAVLRTTWRLPRASPARTSSRAPRRSSRQPRSRRWARLANAPRLTAVVRRGSARIVRRGGRGCPVSAESAVQPAESALPVGQLAEETVAALGRGRQPAPARLPAASTARRSRPRRRRSPTARAPTGADRRPTRSKAPPSVALPRTRPRTRPGRVDGRPRPAPDRRPAPAEPARRPGPRAQPRDRPAGPPGPSHPGAVPPPARRPPQPRRPTVDRQPRPTPAAPGRRPGLPRGRAPVARGDGTHRLTLKLSPRRSATYASSSPSQRRGAGDRMPAATHAQHALSRARPSCTGCSTVAGADDADRGRRPHRKARPCAARPRQPHAAPSSHGQAAARRAARTTRSAPDRRDAGRRTHARDGAPRGTQPSLPTTRPRHRRSPTHRGCRRDDVRRNP